MPEVLEAEKTVDTPEMTSGKNEKIPKRNDRKKKILFTVCGIVLALALAALAMFLFIKPTFSLTGDDVIECEVKEGYEDPGFSAKYLWFDISDRVEVSGEVDTSKVGTYEISYVLDFKGEEHTLSRTVAVVDKTPPEITLKPKEEYVISSSDFYEEPGYTATDNYDGDLTENVVCEKNESDGVLVITYKVSDLSGNEAIAKRRVMVKDIVPPEITLNGETEATIADATWEDPGAAATDDLDGDITDKIEVETDYAPSTEGTFTFKYTVSDAAGNTASAERKLTVKDDAAPVITLSGGSVVYVMAGDAYYEAGAVATDSFEGDVAVAIDGAPNTSALGTYVIKYTAADSKGNTATAERSVIVMQRPTPVAGGITGGGFVSDATIYLTFDDGPSYMTPKILDVLAQYNVKATFFILNYSQANSSLVARAINEGHTIGIHGYSHDYSIIYVSPQAGLENITKLHDKLVADFGYSTNLTRFPGGSSNTVSRQYCAGVMSELCPLAEQMGYNYFDWNVSSQDAAGGYVSADTIYNNVVTYLRKGRGNVVLMHDSYGKETTAEALPRIIEYGLANGYTFAGLSSNTTPVHHPISN